jgi:hypothetical protein
MAFSVIDALINILGISVFKNVCETSALMWENSD